MQPLRPVDIAKADAELAFNELVGFNGHHVGVFRAHGPGAGPWKMHPDTDELLFALEGSVTVELFDPAGQHEAARLEAPALVVVPQGRRHRHVDTDHLVELYFTPGQSLGSEDPSQEA